MLLYKYFYVLLAANMIISSAIMLICQCHHIMNCEQHKWPLFLHSSKSQKFALLLLLLSGIPLHYGLVVIIVDFTEVFGASPSDILSALGIIRQVWMIISVIHVQFCLFYHRIYLL